MKTVVEPVQKISGNAIDLIETSEYPNLVYAFTQVRQIASGVFPQLSDLKLFIGCPHAESKHSHHQTRDTDRSGRMKRALMHTCHFDRTVCVSSHIEQHVKDQRHLVGLMGHEVGHIIADELGIKNTQRAADRMSEKYLGIPIVYKSPLRLQYMA